MTRSSDALAGVARSLKEGALVAFPTDTVYGVGAVAANDRAVRRLFEAKKRDLDKPIPILIADNDSLDLVVEAVPRAGRLLIQRYWPGALTLVLPKKAGFHSLAAGGADSIGVRLSDHPLVQELLRCVGEPLAVTSANLSGEREAVTADEVRESLGAAVDVIIDGGRCPGTPSSVVDLTVEPPRLLREGAIKRLDLERAGGIRFFGGGTA